MADLSIRFAGIKSPNPFWLVSAPPSNSGRRSIVPSNKAGAARSGKPSVLPSSMCRTVMARWHYGSQKMLAIKNVELISDRPLEVNLREIREVKRAWPDRAIVGRPWWNPAPKHGTISFVKLKIPALTALS